MNKTRNVLQKLLDRIIKTLFPEKDLSRNKKTILRYLTECEREALSTSESIELFEESKEEFYKILSKRYLEATQEITTIDEYFRKVKK